MNDDGVRVLARRLAGERRGAEVVGHAAETAALGLGLEPRPLRGAHADVHLHALGLSPGHGYRW